MSNATAVVKAFPSVSVPARSKIPSDSLEDPLSHTASDVAYGHDTIVYQSVVQRTENLTIKKADEIRIVASLYNAARKQTTGSIYSVIVDISETGSLSIGVKDLKENVLAVSMLKRVNTRPGPGETAGIRLGDIIFGINFIPTRNGSHTLIEVLKNEVKRGKKHIHIQGWRCLQLCADEISGFRFTRADEVIVQAYALFRSKVFSDWERWNFIEILLG